MSDLVSVVMATYNGEKFLRQQMDSILNQSYHTIEIIVVDDASTDGTLKLLGDYSELDSRVHVFPAEKNGGVIATFERGLGLARGEFIALSDQDDIFHTDKIELLVTTLKNQPDRDMVLSDLCLIDEAGQEIAPSMWRHQNLRPREGHPFAQLVYVNYATGCSMMFRRRLLDSLLPFPPDCIMHDWWCAVVATREQAGGIALLKHSLTYYRQHTSNVLGAHSGTILSAVKRVPMLEKRTEWYNKNVQRIAGYLSSNFWSEHDRDSIRDAQRLFDNLVLDGVRSFRLRLVDLPTRVRFAIREGYAHTLYMIGITIWPRCVNFFRLFISLLH